jgi:hypothetical protein
MNAVLYENYGGMTGMSVRTGEEGVIVWEVYIREAGVYNISVNYLAPPGKNSDIQRAIFINGELPFFEANPINFRRTWVNTHSEILRDARGNDLRPTQAEQHVWRDYIIQDALGDYNEHLSFYFREGRNTIAFVSQREDMLIHSIRVFQADRPVPYAVYAAGFQTAARPKTADIRIEGEAAVRRSSPMLAPAASMAGPGVYPMDPRYIRMNYIGGTAWSNPGMWIEWELDVPESGLYKIAVNAQQNFNRGVMAFRRVSINGEIPFSELEYISFSFNNRWQVEVLGGEDDPFLIYFEAGTHTIRMETVLGGYAPYLREVQTSVANLNRIYRQILTITGITPDMFRDYQISRRIPRWKPIYYMNVNVSRRSLTV